MKSASKDVHKEYMHAHFFNINNILSFVNEHSRKILFIVFKTEILISFQRFPMIQEPAVA